MDVSGINQNIEIFGRTFHVQSEMILGDRPLIRTTVFVSGRIVGMRESDVDDLDVPDAEVRAQLNAQHALIVENLQQRIERVQAARGVISSSLSGESLLAEIPDLGEIERPVIERRAALNASIRVRRLLARFRAIVDVTPPTGTEQIGDRLTQALTQIEDVIGFPTFADIRIDEQVRFNVLRDALNGWLDSDRDHEDGVLVWSDVAVFSSYLGHVNDRRELIEFDRQMVKWILSTVANTGDAVAMVDHLSALYGHDLELDRIIDDLGEVDGDHMIRTLLALYSAALPSNR